MRWLTWASFYRVEGRCAENYNVIYNRIQQVQFECPYKDTSCNGAVSFWHRRPGLEADVCSQRANNCRRENNYNPTQLPMSRLFWEIKVLFLVYFTYSWGNRPWPKSHAWTLEILPPSVVETPLSIARVACPVACISVCCCASVTVCRAVPWTKSGGGTGLKISPLLTVIFVWPVPCVTPQPSVPVQRWRPCKGRRLRQGAERVEATVEEHLDNYHLSFSCWESWFAESAYVSLDDVAATDTCRCTSLQFWILKRKSLLSEL